MLNKFAESQKNKPVAPKTMPVEMAAVGQEITPEEPSSPLPPEPIEPPDDDLYSVRNFSI